MKLAIAVISLGCLAACTSAPKQVLAPAARRVETTQAPPLPDSPGPAATPSNAHPDEPAVEPAAERPRPALLAGESAREYQRGGASWYGPGFNGRRTASGERYDMNAMTAAHRTLPFGTWV